MQSQSYDNLYSHSKNDHYMVESTNGLKCICEMCSCGKHQCPRKMPKTDFETSYSRYYQKPQSIPQTDQRPPFRYQQRHYSPDVLKTRYQQHFQPQLSLQPEPSFSASRLEEIGVTFYRFKKTIMAPQVPFMGISAYKDQYQPYNLVKKRELENPETQILQSMKSQHYRKPAPKFQGISSYKSEFLPPPEPKKIQQKPAYKIPDAPFYGSTSYKEQYKPIELIPYDCKPQNSPYKNFKTVKFEGKSAYKEQYVPYQQQIKNGYDSRILERQNKCSLDQIVVPKVNYINDKDHVLYDPSSKKFY